MLSVCNLGQCETSELELDAVAVEGFSVSAVARRAILKGFLLLPEPGFVFGQSFLYALIMKENISLDSALVK